MVLMRNSIIISLIDQIMDPYVRGVNDDDDGGDGGDGGVDFFKYGKRWVNFSPIEKNCTPPYCSGDRVSTLISDYSWYVSKIINNATIIIIILIFKKTKINLKY
jgi:hypothetical protein